MNTRWIKVWRDARTAGGRLGLMVAALTVSLTAVVAMLTTFTVLSHEVPRSYIASNPASAQLVLDREIDDSLLTLVRAMPSIRAAEPAAIVGARVQLPDGEQLPLLLFVVPDLATSRVGVVHPVRGAWPPRAGTIQIERTAMALAQTSVGSTISVVFSPGVRRELVVGTTVHDPAVAPAWQEQVVYGYLSKATLDAMRVPIELNRLRIVVADSLAPVAAIEHDARDIARWLETRGLRVAEVQVPPPRQHPHQAQMSAVIRMLLMFSVMGLVLGAVLAAAVINGLMAEQLRQIAIMKAIGAGSRQIAAQYLLLVTLLGSVAVVIGLPLGVAVGQQLIKAVVELLNLRLSSATVPWWVYVTALLLGTLVPIASSLVPIASVSRRSVRSVLDDHGANASTVPDGGSTRWVTRYRSPSAALTLAFRNLFRRRNRMLLTVSLLAGAGAMFLARLDLRAAWERAVTQSAHDRHYELEVRLSNVTPWQVAREQLALEPSVQWAEPWSSVRVAVADTSPLEVSHRYADGGHGAIALRAVPDSQRAVTYRLAAGRLLVPADSDAVVLNDMAHAIVGRSAQPGEWISLRVGRQTMRVRLVGIVEQALTGGTAFVTPRTFARVAWPADSTNAVRVHLVSGASVGASADSLVATLARAGVVVGGVARESRLAAAQGGHVYILVIALASIAMAMAMVGLIGLASSLGVSVLERTREFGVMRAIGCTTRAILTMVLAEGALTALISVAIAVVASRVISGVVGGVLASISNQALKLQLTSSSVVVWMAVVIVGAIAVSCFPAARAARMTVRDALSHS
jgi:putative ABC transport system permease protein